MVSSKAHPKSIMSPLAGMRCHDDGTTATQQIQNREKRDLGGIEYVNIGKISPVPFVNQLLVGIAEREVGK